MATASERRSHFGGSGAGGETTVDVIVIRCDAMVEYDDARCEMCDARCTQIE